MPHDKTRSSLLSNSCHFSLDRRRALTLSPEIKRDSCQAESPLKIPRRVSTAEDERVDTKMSKDRNKSHSKIHWTQLASNGTSSDQEHTIWQEIQRRQVKVVLEDVLQTEIGQRLLRCGQKTNQSESKRQSDHTSTAALKDKRRTSLTKRGEIDSTGPKATSPSHNQTESSTENESCPHKEIKNPKSKQLNSSLKLLESSEVSGNSCSPRESDSPQAVQISEQLPKQTKPSTSEKNEVLLLEGSLQHEDALSSGCESLRSPSSSLARRCSLREETSGSENLPNKKERRETQECPKYASEDTENHLLRNGEVVQEVDGTRGSVIRLSVEVDGEIQVKRFCIDSLSGEHVPNSDPAYGTTEGRSYNTESSKLTPSEPIILSSEEEEEQEGEESKEVEASSLNIQPLEGAKDMNKEDKSSSAVIELQLSSLHMGGVSANCESMKVTTDKITFSLRGSSVNISISTPNVCKYSVWDEPILSACGLAKDSEVPPPSLVLFWLSDNQAHRLRNDLSVILPDTCPAEGSTCVLLCLAEPVTGVECALLASLMDMVQNQSSSILLSPLTQSDSLKVLQSSQETHLLQLLMPETDPQTSTAAHAAVSAVKSQDSDVHLKPVYTLCHSRAQGSYSVTLAPTLGAEWTPYQHCGPAHRLIQFPPPPTKGAITVTTEDLECLDSGEFLNDVIIDFYLKYLLVQKAPQASVDRSHVFSSFFYKQLTRRDNANEDSTSTPAQVRRHQRVRTWTRHVDIFDKDFLFVPVNQEAHWYLVVICFPGLEEPQYVKRDGRDSVQGDGGEGLGESEGEIHGENRSNSDEDKDDSRIKSSMTHLPKCTENTCKRPIVCKRPCILIMDSLKLSVHERIFKLLREYLQVEWQTKRGGHRDFSGDHMIGSHCTVPLQDNSSDCGLYLLQYAESFLQDPVVDFELPLRLERWFPRQQVRGKREEIRDLILHLYRFQQGSLGHESLEDRTDHGNVIQ
ncbi:sentrin-specific protease 7 isoform X1 [Sinocyclocheilus grahami]|uniref:Ubiquitin-like protease family profile domain-containing protein n=1 Tax=Sinocyclocheilus grahami TaxID=75366 RepID=A0A672RM29_SINGR|nr:PREDICTED: sentrin-specific protease 7 isoform X1 [Sinocyclocheilus grahami]XP_016093443.1 PREDICTED: sentrin-specific protease 7 isoform X1 [Sinocyclocheilus grahami]XP_016093444.1 PREDICTED: sentrin-specific protease 7 isoform X1 [Sinocyclocheilus grahami]XP_016093445.1 PREDICTED: sentrin-specific protease 7 isoform X1 [Sinocyclocheilus grahami]